MTSNLSVLVAETVLAYSPCFLYAVRRELSSRIEVHVYRSVKVKDRHRLYLPVLDVVGDTEPTVLEVMDDESMAFNKAESLLYVLAKDEFQTGTVVMDETQRIAI